MRQTRTSRTRVRFRVAGAGRVGPAYLFVYGTLARGQQLHGHLKRFPGNRFMGEAKIRGELYAIPKQSYPGAVKSSSKNGFVFGELYKLSNPDATLKQLDAIEGCAEGLFQRVVVDVFSNAGKKKAWAYFYAQPLKDAELIPSGVFQQP